MTSAACLLAFLLVPASSPVVAPPTPAAPAMPGVPTAPPAMPGMPDLGMPPPALDPAPPALETPVNPAEPGPGGDPRVPPAAGAPPMKVLVLTSVVAEGSAAQALLARGVLTEQFSDLKFLAVALPGDADVGTVVAAAMQAAGAPEDPVLLAQAGKAANAEKVVSAVLAPRNGRQAVGLTLVDVRTGLREWGQLDSAEDDSTRALALLHDQAGALSRYLYAAYGPPTLRPAGQPPPLAAVAPPKTEVPVPAARKPFLNAWRGMGLALLGAGVAVLPLSVVALVAAGAGHMAGAQLAFYRPGSDRPRFYSPAFTLTWADFLVPGAVLVGGVLLVGAGAVLVLIPW